jgi:hypothetical protein
MRIKCVNGPYDGYKVNSNLGDRWPFVLLYEYDNPEILVGYYVKQDGHYFWEGKNEVLVLPGLKATGR